MSQKRISKEDAVLLAQNLLLRERLDLTIWDLRQMRLNVIQMRKYLGAPLWGKEEKVRCDKAMKSLDELEQVIANRDATRVDAAHTHFEHALSELREVVFGV